MTRWVWRLIKGRARPAHSRPANRARGTLGWPRALAWPAMRRGAAHRDQARLLLVGAGDHADLFLRALARDSADRCVAVGIVDEMGTYLRSRIQGVEVLGAVGDLADIVARLDGRGVRPHRLVLTDDSLAGAALRELSALAAPLDLPLFRAPSRSDLNNGFGAALPMAPIAADIPMAPGPAGAEADLNRTSKAPPGPRAEELVAGLAGRAWKAERRTRPSS